MDNLKRVVLFAIMAPLCVCVYGSVVAMKKGKSSAEIAKLKVEKLKAEAEAAELRAKAAESRARALAAELALAEGEEEEVEKEAVEVPEEEKTKDDAATDLATKTPDELGGPLIAFAGALKDLSAEDVEKLEAKIGTSFGHHGHWGRGMGMRRGHGGPGSHLALSDLVEELGNLKDVTKLSEGMRFQLIRWAWHIVRMKEEDILSSSNPLVQKAQKIVDDTPSGRGHHRFHGRFGWGHGPGCGCGESSGSSGPRPGRRGPGGCGPRRGPGGPGGPGGYGPRHGGKR